MGIQFVGGVKPVYEFESLTQISNTVVSELDTLLEKPCDVCNPYLYLTYKLTNSVAGNKNVSFMLFMSTDPNVSSTNYMAHNTYQGEIKVGNGKSSFWYDQEKFTAGTKIYIVAYGDSKNSDGLFDYTTGKIIYPCLNATKSNVISYTIPADNK